MTYLDTLQEQFVAASRELHRARRRRVRRRGAVCAALIVLITPPALAATGVWRPELGDGRTPAPEIAEDAPPPDQLAALGVLRRPQNDADRGVASRYALKFVSSPAVQGVRTDSIRLLSSADRGIVLVPVRRYKRQPPPIPADAPPEVRKLLDPPPIDDALCIFQIDVDGAGTGCYSTADVREGRVWMALGRRALWLVPDGVASVRSEYEDGQSVDAPVRGNAAVFAVPGKQQIMAQRTTFLDAAGKPVRVIEPPHGGRGMALLPAEADPPAPGSTHSGVVRRVAIRADRYELLVRLPRRASITLVLYRPGCLSPRRVVERQGTILSALRQIDVHPSLGDRDNPTWCRGTYRGYLRVDGKRRGTFSFAVRR